jgi:hypothetical protein
MQHIANSASALQLCDAMALRSDWFVGLPQSLQRNESRLDCVSRASFGVGCKLCSECGVLVGEEVAVSGFTC